MKRYLIFRKCPIDWTNRSKCNLEVTKRTGENCPLIEKKHLSGVKFRSAKCPDVWTNRSGKTSDYSRGCREMRRGLSAQGGFCGVQSTAQITGEISTFLHKMKKPGEVPSCYIYSVVSGSDSAAIAVFIPSLNPCSKPCRSYSTA